MSEQTTKVAKASTRVRGLLQRRGMIAGVAALAAGLLGRTTTKTAEATHGVNDGLSALHVGVTNNTAASTTWARSSGASGTTAIITNDNGNAIFAQSISATGSGLQAFGTNGDAIRGSSAGIGVYGETFNTFGVVGTVQSGGSNNATGVKGTASGGIGVYGASAGGVGVFGDSNLNTAVNGRSIEGAAVYGTSTNNIGIRGQSTNNIGGYGASTTSHGLWGDAGGGNGVVGRAATGIGVYGTATGAGGQAARFDGSVTVNGGFTVVGGPKSAGVRTADGSIRRMYCQEAPEPFFEDFGRATLTDGRAEVALNGDFMAVVNLDGYFVFPVAQGDCNGLFVSSTGSKSFVIEELRGGKSSVPFSYRVVAHRGDSVGARLEKVDQKAPRLNEPPRLPELPEAA